MMSVENPGGIVNHRHLLPDEIDLLLDEALGFGVAPLKAHVRDCAECRARIDEARFVVDSLENVPHFAPSHTFADRVMAQVPVFVPWHVAARDQLRAWVPEWKPARVAVAAFAGATGVVLSVALVWLATQTNALAIATDAAGTQVRDWVIGAAQGAAAAVLGEHAV